MKKFRLVKKMILGVLLFGLFIFIELLINQNVYASTKGSYIVSGETLHAEDDLISPNGQYEAIQQNDGNFVIYENTSDGRNAIWSADTGEGYSDVYITLQSDGNLVIYGDGQALWSSQTCDAPGNGFFMQMQDDGNLVVYNNSSTWLWSSMFGKNTAPFLNLDRIYDGQSLRNEQKLVSPNGQYEAIQQNDGNFVIYENISDGRNAIWSANTGEGYSDVYITLQSDGNLVIYGDGQALWSSQTCDAPGNSFFLQMQDDGNLVLYNNSSTWLWSSKQGKCDFLDKSFGDQVVDYAMNFLGIMYKANGSDPRGFDCSGFTMYVYQHFGINIPRNSAAQASYGIGIPLSQALPGDIVCYLGHVAIYIGNNKIIHSPTPNNPIRIASINIMPITTIRRVY